MHRSCKLLTSLQRLSNPDHVLVRPWRCELGLLGIGVEVGAALIFIHKKASVLGFVRAIRHQRLKRLRGMFLALRFMRESESSVFGL